MSDQYSKYLDILEPHPEYLICLSISPDGNFLVSSCYDVVRIWDLRDGTLICSHKHYKTDVGFSLIVSSNWKHFITDYDDRIEIRDLLTGERLYDFPVDSSNTMRSSLDGTFLITAEHVKYLSGTGKAIKPVPIKAWNLQTGELIRTFQGHDYMVSSLSISRDGSTLLSHSYYHSTKLWDLRTGQELHTFSLLPSGYKYWVDSFAITSTGEMLATGCKFKSNDRDHVSFEMWNLLTGQTIHSFPKIYRYQCIKPPWEPGSVMTPDGKILVSGNDVDLEVWNGQTGEMICRLQGHEHRVRNLTMSQDGGKIASYGDDGIRIWKRTPL
jgi:WD40 repeat protein